MSTEGKKSIIRQLQILFSSRALNDGIRPEQKKRLYYRGRVLTWEQYLEVPTFLRQGGVPVPVEMRD